MNESATLIECAQFYYKHCINKIVKLKNKIVYLNI